MAPPESPARGPGSSLSKLLHLLPGLGPGRPPGRDLLALHQSDWISGRLAGRYGWSDWNNVLKLGYDPQRLAWPDWVLGLVSDRVRLPRALAPGAVLGSLSPRLAAEFGLDPRAQILAGTTDSTAAALAAGARVPGEAVTSLGSTLVLKILSPQPLSASRFGIYSHRFGDHWLVGGPLTLAVPSCDGTLAMGSWPSSRRASTPSVPAAWITTPYRVPESASPGPIPVSRPVSCRSRRTACAFSRAYSRGWRALRQRAIGCSPASGRRAPSMYLRPGVDPSTSLGRPSAAGSWGCRCGPRLTRRPPTGRRCWVYGALRPLPPRVPWGPETYPQGDTDEMPP